jgi:hypothetical protein
MLPNARLAHDHFLAPAKQNWRRQNFEGNCDNTNLIHDNYVIIASSRRPRLTVRFFSDFRFFLGDTSAKRRAMIFFGQSRVSVGRIFLSESPIFPRQKSCSVHDLIFSHSIDNVYQKYLNLHACQSFSSDGMHSARLVACFT